MGEQNNIQWRESSYESQVCLAVGDIEYMVELVDNTGEVVEQRVVTSDSCSNGTCSILIPLSGTCLVKVQATSRLGNSTMEELNIAGVRLTTTNQALLVAGVIILLSVAIVITIILIIMTVLKKGSKVSLLLLMVGCFLVVLSLTLWIAVAFQLGLQEDTCDPSWQSTRDDLIIAAHVISDLAFLVEAVTAGFLCIAVCCGHYCMKSTSNNKQKSNLERGAGGRVLELEERKVDEFKEPGEGLVEARSRVGEERFQEYDRIQHDCKLKEQEIPGSATPTQPSIYSRLNPYKKRRKEEGEGGHYQHLDHEMGKREDKANDHKSPLGSPEEYGILDMPPPAGGVPNSRDVPKGVHVNGSGKGDKKEETLPAPKKPPRSPAAQPHTSSSKGTGQGTNTAPESKPGLWSRVFKPNTSSSSGTGSVAATGMHLPAAKSSSNEGEGSATAAGSKSGLARNIPAPDSVDGAVEDKARSKQIETDYKTYAKLAPRGKMSLVLDEEHGGEDTHLERISEYFAEDWDTTVAPTLGLTEEEIKRIKKKHKGKPDLQKRQALKMWKDREGPNATYGNLLRLLLTCEKRLCASVLSKLWS